MWANSKRLLLVSTALMCLLAPTTFAVADAVFNGPFLRYSYRDHYRAYGATSPRDPRLPEAEYYPDVCHRWSDVGKKRKLKWVCRY